MAYSYQRTCSEWADKAQKEVSSSFSSESLTFGGSILLFVLHLRIFHSFYFRIFLFVLFFIFIFINLLIPHIWTKIKASDKNILYDQCNIIDIKVS